MLTGAYGAEPLCRLDELPVLPNGKLDRFLLAALEIGAGGDTRTYEVPQGALEETIAKVWSDAFGGDRVGRHDNFFALALLLATLSSFVVNNFTDFDPQTLAIDKATDVDELIGRFVQEIERRNQQGNPLWHLAYESADGNRLFLARLVAHWTAMNA